MSENNNIINPMVHVNERAEKRHLRYVPWQGMLCGSDIPENNNQKQK
jgi:hypothetical protein